MKHIYFKAKGYGYEDDLLTELDIIEAARIIEGVYLSYKDEDKIREYAKKCKGVGEEVKRPSVRHLINKGKKVDAIRLYRDIHDCDALEAVNKVNEMIKQMKKDL